MNIKNDELELSAFTKMGIYDILLSDKSKQACDELVKMTFFVLIILTTWLFQI